MKTIHAMLLALALLPAAALAEERKAGKYGGEDRGQPLQPATPNPTWAKECSACHIAYAPGLLPAASWRKLMAGLDKHFGTDASLTAPENQDVAAFLVANASKRWTSANAPLRITESAWFKSKHSAKEVAPAVWKRASVKSPANCQACHGGAEKADFNERSIKIPQ
jgi:mono/diheme cytochrome c family protein